MRGFFVAAAVLDSPCKQSLCSMQSVSSFAPIQSRTHKPLWLFLPCLHLSAFASFAVRVPGMAPRVPLAGWEAVQEFSSFYSPLTRRLSGSPKGPASHLSVAANKSQPRRNIRTYLQDESLGCRGSSIMNHRDGTQGLTPVFY